MSESHYPEGPWDFDLLTWGFFFILSLMEEESRLVNSTQQLGIKGISSAREKAHCSAKEFPEKTISATSSVTWSMSCNCQLVAMGQQTNIWGRDCALLCSDCGNQFNPACVLNQQALPYWVGRQHSSEIFQTENWRVRGIPGFIFSSVWIKGQGLGPHRIQLATEFHVAGTVFF